MSSTHAAVASLQSEWAMPRINFSRVAVKAVEKPSARSAADADAGAAKQPCKFALLLK